MEIGARCTEPLYGVVEHSGSLRGGHSIVREGAACLGTARWDVAAFQPARAKASDVPAFLEDRQETEEETQGCD